MSITLDVNTFLNKDVCSTVCDDTMENEMETNIFDEIEHLLKFNKNLEYENRHKVEEKRKKKAEEKCKKKVEEYKKDNINLDFLNSTPDDFLLTSDSQSLLGEDPILYTVEQDRLQPVSSRFMVPGIYKRIEGVATNSSKLAERKPNVFISEFEKQGRIITQQDFERLYIMPGESEMPALTKVLLLAPLENDYNDDGNVDDGKNKVLRQENNVKNTIPKEWDALNRLAYDILKLTNRDHIVIDRKRNEIIRTQYKTHQKTTYRFLSPVMLGLKRSSEIIDLEEEEKFQSAPKFINKLGRPPKRVQEVKTVKKTNKVIKNSATVVPTAPDNKTKTSANLNLRSRFGRLIKTPHSAQQNLISLLPPPSPQESITNLLNDLRDSDYQCGKVNNKEEPSVGTASPTETIFETQKSPKRKIPPEAICPTCKKIFLGKRLMRHFATHPDHMQISNNSSYPAQNINTTEVNEPAEEMSLFRFLISKLQNSQTLNEDQRADLFLYELNDLIEQLQLRSSRLIRNTSGLHFVNTRCSKILGIPEGHYALDLSAIEAPLDPELTTQFDNCISQNHHSQPNNISLRNLDYTNLSITLDDTLTDEAAQKLNLSAGGKLLPPSEESLLRAVGDFVQTDINKIRGSSMLQQHPVSTISPLSSSSNATSMVVAELLPPHIDHASDNAVEAVHMKETTTTVSASENHMLDLSVDFFQFNN